MKISLLLKREPFREIFETTCSSFLSELYNSRINVKWISNNNKSEKSGQIWYCNPQINSIFVKGVNKRVFDTIIGEYSTNPLRPWRSFFQRVYLFFATNPFTAHLLSKYKIKLLPPIDMAEHKLFLGGTTKIRLIDIQNQKVYVILKKGYSDHYYENELTIRNQHKYLPAPKLFEINYDGRWYCEEYISGVSPDRLKYGEADIMGQAIKPLRLLYQSTFQQKSKEEYLKNICNSIHSNLKQSYNRNNYDLNRIISIVDTLYSKLLSKLPSKIAICQNHGDLQPGNILWNAELEKLWIIDWEFTRERQYGFDFFTILLSVRSKVGSAKILHAAEHGISEDNYLLKMFPDLSKGNLEVFLLLFLLEELDFKVEELKYYQLKQKHDGLINYISCLESILNKNI